MQSEAAMLERRMRILSHAGKLLAKNDPDAFSLRNLASAAKVSVNTIYNLIGDKNAVMLEICREMVRGIHEKLEQIQDEMVLERLEATVIVTTDLPTPGQQNARRAANIAFDTLSRDLAYKAEAEDVTRPLSLFRIRALQTGQKLNLLRGAMPADVLDLAIGQGEMMALLDWTYRRISLDEYRKRALLALYVPLMADANKKLHTTLQDRIQMLG